MIACLFITGILTQLCAQTSPDRAFQVPDDIIINRRFFVNLDKGNRMEIELTDINDLQTIANIDSILQLFVNDITPLKDSVAGELTSKRIDYISDVHGRRKIRLQQFQPKGATYLVNKDELASLRIQQDTISIIGVINNAPKAQQKVSANRPRYYHITFYLNNMNELAMYTHGVLAEKFQTILNNVNSKWSNVLGSGDHYLVKDKSITAAKPKGFTDAGTGDFLAANAMVNIQNYKNYFVPSFSLGLKLTLSNRNRNFKWETGLFWEPHFLFAKDTAGKLRTYRNDFLTLTYGQGGTKDHDPRKDFTYSAVFSLGYLINRNGNYFDKNTFRFGAGKLSLLKTTIEPSIYFNNFFKGVTPGIRITQYF